MFVVVLAAVSVSISAVRVRGRRGRRGEPPILTTGGSGEEWGTGEDHWPLWGREEEEGRRRGGQ